MQCAALKDCHVTVCDINKNMLDVGISRFQKLNYDKELISWEIGDAENLHFPDNSFDAYTIGFGCRNVTYVDKVGFF